MCNKDAPPMTSSSPSHFVYFQSYLPCNYATIYFSIPAVDPPSDLFVKEISSKSMKITWKASPSQITGYRIQLTPMLAGSKPQAVNVGPKTTSHILRDLSPDTEYEINVFAMKELTASEPISTMEKTQAVNIRVGKLLTLYCLPSCLKSFLIPFIKDRKCNLFLHRIIYK